MNKKGAEMAIGTIIVIVIALVVLVVLVYGFSTGWGNLWSKVTGFGGDKTNVNTVIQSCEVACTSGNKYGYCTQMRRVIFDDSEKEKNGWYDCKALDVRDVAGLSCSGFSDDTTCAPNPGRGEDPVSIDESAPNGPDPTTGGENTNTPNAPATTG